MALSLHPSFMSKSSEVVELAEPSAVPSYIRYIADEILGNSPPTDPPEYLDILHMTSLEPLKLDWEEDHSEETAVSRGISILCDFAAENPDICSWLEEIDILTLCQILTKKEQQPIKEQQQVARLVALLSQSQFDGAKFGDWIPWLERRVESPDLLLSSNAFRALVHIKQGQTGTSKDAPSFQDGIHFFNPQASLCDSLVLNQSMDDGTLVDVVFVHGIRGGPYITWRSEGTSESHNTRDSCWPSHWLLKDLPKARLISVGFAAPVSSWEGGSGPLKQTAWTVFDKLREAGIGDRPVIFVAHSMGGIIVKELLARAMDKPLASTLVDNTRGIVFVSTPHHGVWLAHLAWGLRHIGACPAPSLNTMKPGPYLEDLNAKIQEWVKKRDIPILNFAETQSTNVSSVMPKVHVVPSSSAFPGYGQCISLPGLDHVTSCKPKHPTDAFYHHTLTFLKNQISKIE